MAVKEDSSKRLSVVKNVLTNTKQGLGSILSKVRDVCTLPPRPRRSPLFAFFGNYDLYLYMGNRLYAILSARWSGEFELASNNTRVLALPRLLGFSALSNSAMKLMLRLFPGIL